MTTSILRLTAVVLIALALVTVAVPSTAVAQEHYVTTPGTPSGPSSGEALQSLTYGTGGSYCNQHGYNVQYRFSWGDGSYSSWSSSASASHSWSPPGSYSVKAQARCAVVTSVVSEWSSGKTVTIKLPKPGALSATAQAASSIGLAWTDRSSTWENEFRIERKTGTGGVYSQIATVGANVETYTDSGLSYGTYYYRVRAWSSAYGFSDYSNEDGATLPPCSCTSFENSEGNPELYFWAVQEPCISPTNHPCTFENPPSQTLYIGTSTPASFTWSVSDDAAWLSCSPPSGSYPAQGQVSVDVNVAGLVVPGAPEDRCFQDFYATVTLNRDDSGCPDTCAVNVQLRLYREDRCIAVRCGSSCLPCDGLEFSAVQGYPLPPAQSFCLCEAYTPCSSQLEDWVATDDAGWLDLSPTTGTCPPTCFVSASVNTTNLPVGTHQATVTVSAERATCSPQTSTVTLTIEQAPEISYSPSSFYFETVEDTDPPDQTLSIWNSGAQTLDWSVTDDAYWPDWLTVTPDSGSSTGETDVATVSVDCFNMGMGAGTRYATITISAPGATNTPQTVPVTLVIAAGPPAICHTPDGWGTGAVENGPNPPCCPLTITNCGSIFSTLEWSVTSAATWLYFIPESGTCAGQGETDLVSMCVDKTGMSAGDYTATVTISAPGATSKYVDVTLEIRPPTSPNAPTGLVAAAAADRIDLSWQDNSDNESGFKIERKTTSDFGEIANVGADVASYSDTAVSGNATYYYRVRAYNDIGYSEYSNTASATIGEGEGCFIATAACGPDDSGVETLRAFRDGYMVGNPVGSALTSAYYRLSPPMARFIDDHPALKPAVRAGLTPAVAISDVAVGTTLVQKAAIAGAVFCVSVLAVLGLRRRTARRRF